MAHIFANRVAEFTTSTGTGALALTAATGYKRFNSALKTSDTAFYMVEAVDANGAVTGAFEFGLGTYSATDTLTRTTPLGSSNGNSLVNFAAGNKRVTLSLLVPDSDTSVQWRNALGLGKIRSITSFGAVNAGKEVNSPISSRYTLAQAQAKFGSFITNITDQIDWAALQAAVNWMDANSIPIDISGPGLNLNRPTIMGANFCRIEGGDVNVSGKLMANGFIASYRAPQPTEYPTDTSAGPFGVFFYFPKTIYYAVINNVHGWDSMGHTLFNKDANSPTLSGCTSNYSHFGVGHYQGCQNAMYSNIGGVQLGCWHWSSSTCFATGNPYTNLDNYYTDNVKLHNGIGPGFNSLGLRQQAAFDTWFKATVLRPDVDSITLNGSTKYVDQQGTVYTDDYVSPEGRVWLPGTFTNPTGRAFFVPYRTVRRGEGLTIVGLDSRGPVHYGYILFNTEIKFLKIAACQYEGMFSDGTPDDRTPAIITMGSLQVGSSAEMAQDSYVDLNHSFVGYTGRGISGGGTSNERLWNLGTSPILFKDVIDVGFINDFLAYRRAHIPAAENSQLRAQGYSGENFPADFAVNMDDAIVVTNNDSGVMIKRTTPRVIHLPFKGTDGILRGSAMLTFNTHIAGGYMGVYVKNNTSGTQDYAIYEVSTDGPETLTLAQALANSDTQVVFTTGMLRGGGTPRFSYYFPVQSDGITPITGTNAGKGFAVEQYIGSNTATLVNRMSGLASNFAVGQKFRRVQTLNIVRPFASGTSMLQLTTEGLGNSLPGQESNKVGIRNGPGASTQAAAALLNNLTITLMWGHFPEFGG